MKFVTKAILDTGVSLGAHAAGKCRSQLTQYAVWFRNTQGHDLVRARLGVGDRIDAQFIGIARRADVGDIAIVEVQPSNLPPVRYKQRVWIRRGPRKALANESEESILIERRTAAARSFDAQPCVDASLSDLSLDLFTNNYRHLAVDPEILAENHRPVEQQLASLRFFDLSRNCPTYAGIILFAQDSLRWLPNAYIQYVRFDGTTLDADVVAEKTFQGNLLSVVSDIKSFVTLFTNQHPVRRSAIEPKSVAAIARKSKT